MDIPEGFRVRADDLKAGVNALPPPKSTNLVKLSRTLSLLDSFASYDCDTYPGLDERQTERVRDAVTTDEEGTYDLGALLDALPVLELSDGFGRQMSIPIEQASAGLFIALQKLEQ